MQGETNEPPVSVQISLCPPEETFFFLKQVTKWQKKPAKTADKTNNKSQREGKRVLILVVLLAKEMPMQNEGKVTLGEE